LGKLPIKSTAGSQLPAIIPDTLNAQIRETLGAEAHDALVEALGGAQIYIPQKIGAHHPLAQAMGLEEAVLLSRHFAGETLVLPVTQRKRAIIEEGLRKNEPVLRIARRAVCSPRFVWKVKAELASAKEPDQQGLF